MPATVEAHHHRSTTKVSQKPYRPRFTSKNALKEQSKGKVESLKTSSRKTPHQQVMSKLDRRNQAKQKRLLNHQDHVKATTVFARREGAPRIVAIVPLCEDIHVEAAVRSINESLDISEEVASAGLARVQVDRFKQKLGYITVRRDLFSVLDACRVADYVVLVLSADEEVDELGETFIRCIEGQGVSQVYCAVQGLDSIDPPKRRPQVVASLKSFITHFFPTQEKVFSLDSRQECQNMARSLCTTIPKGIRWREDRSWMAVEEVRWTDSSAALTADDAKGSCVLTGVIRGKNLKADRLVQVGNWGDFQIEKITAAPLDESKKGKSNAMDVVSSSDTSLDTPSADQDTLDELAPEEVVMDDIDIATTSIAASDRKGVLLDDQRYYSDDEAEEATTAPRRLPRGTSKYQSAWYLDDISDSGSDLEDVDNEQDDDMSMRDTGITPADGLEGLHIDDGAETEAGAGPSEYPQSELFMDPAPEDEAEDITAYRNKRKSEAQEDLQFPDEIELHPEVLARERLARYRGLKSLRTSPWNTEEDQMYEPADWRRLLDISDYRGAKNRVLREALVGGVKAGTRVRVHLRSVPLSLQQTYDASKLLALFSLLRHEHKRTAINVSFTLDSEYSEPLRSKEELIVQCGPRRFVVNPLFSQAGNTPNDVHKFERYLHPGRTAVATFIAPLTWGSAPCLFFKRPSPSAKDTPSPTDHDADIDMAAAAPSSPPTAGPLTLIGHGTLLPPSTTRTIAKRIVLTGEAFKVNRSLVTIRYMFFNTLDVAWFKALSLWTNRGRQGTIKESLGTHGYFKAVFDGKVGMQDAIGVSLYKRVWPRQGRLIGVGELV